VDEDFGPFFLKFCSYFSYNAKLCINGHDFDSNMDGATTWKRCIRPILP
jgi:hypothetical protein